MHTVYIKYVYSFTVRFSRRVLRCYILEARHWFLWIIWFLFTKPNQSIWEWISSCHATNRIWLQRRISEWTFEKASYDMLHMICISYILCFKWWPAIPQRVVFLEKFHCKLKIFPSIFFKLPVFFLKSFMLSSITAYPSLTVPICSEMIECHFKW